MRSGAIALGAVALAGLGGGAQAVAPALGRVWERPQEVSLPNVVDEPQVAAGPDGATVAVWSRGSYQPGTESLRLSIVESASLGTDGRWGAPQILSPPGPIAIGAQVATDDHGDAVAAWSASDGVWAAERPAGAPWGGAFRLSAPGARAGGVRIAMDGAGAAVAVWLRDAGRGRAALDAAQRAAGGGWGRRRRSPPPTRARRLPRSRSDRAAGGWPSGCVWTGASSR